MPEISRRDVIKLSVVGLGAAFLTACGLKSKPAQSPNPAATALPASTGPAAPNPTRATKAGSEGQKPQSFPTSSYAPSTSDFNLVLGRPTANAISGVLFAKQAAQVVLSYGTAPGAYTNQTSPVNLPANTPQNVDLAGLSPNSTYYFQILINGAPAGEHSFHTQRAPGSSFTFTIDADPHNRDPNFNGQLYAIALANAAADHPDFHVNLGDTFMTEKVNAQTVAEAASTFSDMRPYLGIIGTQAPLFLVNGNHEGELGWMFTKGPVKDLPVWSAKLRGQYYPTPQPGGFYTGGSTPDNHTGGVRDGYYALTWGDAHILVLDPFWYTTDKPRPDDLNNNWSWTLGREQYDWLKTTLANSTSKFKFVFIHNLAGGNDKDARGGIEAAPFFEWGGKNADGSDGFEAHRPGWGKPTHQLLVENHVSAVFHGHDHVFVKQDLDGIVYQECPQPSITRYDNTQLAQDYGYTHGDVVSSSGHLRLSVTPAKVTVEYVRAYLPQDENASQKNRQVSYTYTIQ